MDSANGEHTQPIQPPNCPNSSVRDKILAFQNRTETPSPPTMTKEVPAPVSHKNSSNGPPLLMPKPSKSVVIPPKKPARTKLSQSAAGSSSASAVELRQSSQSQLETELSQNNKLRKDSCSSLKSENHGKIPSFYNFLQIF